VIVKANLAFDEGRVGLHLTTVWSIY
jgi:hypothetical protein